MSERGSQWQKWDLHVHTPASFESHYSNSRDNGKHETGLESEFVFDNEDNQLWKRYINELEDIEDISVIGITDYFNIRGYKIVHEHQTKGRLDNFDLIVPNIEFRLDNVVTSRKDSGRTKRINFHVVFNSELDPEVIEEEFLHQLKIPRDNGKGLALTRRNLEKIGQEAKEQEDDFSDLSDYDVGCKVATVRYEDIINALQSSERFAGEYLIILAEDGWDLIDWASQGHDLRRRLLADSHALFSPNEETRRWGLGKHESKSAEKIEDLVGSLKPCLHGSDAHDFESLCSPDNDRYCWIKANTTFDGLKQVIYEPEERVSIGSHNPKEHVPIHTLDRITVRNGEVNPELEVNQHELPLNENLVTVIGSQGEGKTALLDLLANCFEDRCKRHSGEPDDDNSFVQRIEDEAPGLKTKIEFTGKDVKEFSKSLNDEEFVSSSDIVYLPQGKIVEYCRNKTELHKRILGLIKSGAANEDPSKLEDLEQIEDEISSIESDIRSLNSEIYEYNPPELQDRISEVKLALEKERGKLEDKKSEIQLFRDRHEVDLEDDAATDYQEELEGLTGNESVLKDLIDQIKNTTEELNDLKSLNEEFSKIEEVSGKFGYDVSVPRFQTDSRQELLEATKRNINRELSANVMAQDRIRDRLEKLSEKQQDLSSILDEKRRIEIEIGELNDEKKQLKEDLENAEDARKKRRKKFQEYTDKHIELRSAYEEVVDVFSNRQSDILDGLEFEPRVQLAESLIGSLESSLDNRSIKPDELESDVNFLRSALECDNSAERKEKINKYIDSIEERREKTTKAVKPIDFDELVYEPHFQLSENVLFNGSRMDKLSLGQRGTVLLKILLAESDAPLIIDQPEENLDNRFIYDTLGNAFREAKMNRQIIIATHDANLVVNTDAEQVVISRFDDGRITFRSGAIENSEIRKEITTLLEGGEQAFREREQKYEFNV